MEYEPQDQDIIRLLTKLKNAEAAYPEDMFVARRETFLMQMAELGAGTPPDGGVRKPLKTADTPPVSPLSSTVLEAALLVAILVEVSAVAYFYRDELSEFLRNRISEPMVQEVSPLPTLATDLAIQGVTPTAVVTATTPSATLSTSPTAIMLTAPGTAVPAVVEGNPGGETAGNETTGSGASASQSTPAPNTGSGDNGNTGNDNSGNSQKDDQGNHYGQTPKPERTKESGSNNANPPQEDNPQPPPEETVEPDPAENGKPPKEKKSP